MALVLTRLLPCLLLVVAACGGDDATRDIDSPEDALPCGEFEKIVCLDDCAAEGEVIQICNLSTDQWDCPEGSVPLFECR